MNKNLIHQLREKGVKIPNPETVYLSDDLDVNRISGKGVTLYSGTKLIGKKTLVLDNVTLGYEAPVTLENTLVGPDSKLHGGYFQETVFLGKNVFGSGAHVRKGTILEEQANAAHTVGLKQTILFPFVTLGSLINFCDCFMAGGTSRKDHSEVGSSFIHFNYTPNQDKATPSMMGNVHQGVMLNQPPIFLGGQGGLVGPIRLGFGSITAAGSVVRKSEEEPNRLILGGGLKNMSMARRPGIYTNPTLIVNHNIAYIAGLISLEVWYKRVRSCFVSDVFPQMLLDGLQYNLRLCIKERISRLKALGEKLEVSKDLISGGAKSALESHDKAMGQIKIAEEGFESALSRQVEDGPDAQIFLSALETTIARTGKDYIQVIQNLPDAARATGSEWLKQIEDKIVQPSQT